MNRHNKKHSWFRKTMKITLILLIVFIIAAVIEHFIKFSDPKQNLTIPNITHLDDYLSEQESAVTGITPNTEKTIKWHQGIGEKTEYVIVYLHGYSATRQETAPLSSLLAQQLNANAYFTRLTGHGLDDERMIEGNLKAWKKDTLEAYEIAKRLGDKVILVSVSTGSTLSTWLVNHLKDDSDSPIVAQIMISPNFESRDMNLYILDWPLGIGMQVAKLVTGNDRHEWEPHNAAQDTYWSNHYYISGLRPLAQLMKQVKTIDKSKLLTPSLFIYSSKDTVVSTKGITDTYKAYGSKKKQIITYDESHDPSNHVLAGDILSPHSTQDLLEFILEFLNENEIIN